MDCSVIYYIAYKTGYIQRSLAKKMRTMTSISVKSGYAAVSPQDLQVKFRRALRESELVIVIGGLEAGGDNDVMNVLSDCFARADLPVVWNKRVLNEQGSDGYLINTGKRYVLVLPDDPDAVSRMFGAELLKNIETSSPTPNEIKEPVRTHTVVFAPEPDSGMDRLKNSGRPSLVTVIAISIAAAVCILAALWVWYILGL